MNGGPTRSLNYRFDADGNVTNLWSGTFRRRDECLPVRCADRLTNVLADGSAAAGYGFDTVGNLQTMRYGNGVTNLYQYDRLNRLTNAVWKLNASTLASFYYQLGLTGQSHEPERDRQRHEPDVWLDVRFDVSAETGNLERRHQRHVELRLRSGRQSHQPAPSPRPEPDQPIVHVQHERLADERSTTTTTETRPTRPGTLTNSTRSTT